MPECTTIPRHGRQHNLPALTPPPAPAPATATATLQLLLSSLLWFLPLRLLSLLSMVQVGLRSLKLLAFFKLHVCLAVLTHLLVLDMLRLLLMHAFTWMPLGCWCC